MTITESPAEIAVAEFDFEDGVLLGAPCKQKIAEGISVMLDAVERMAEVKRRQKPSRSGSIQHMVPVAPVWPKTLGPRTSPQLPVVPR